MVTKTGIVTSMVDDCVIPLVPGKAIFTAMDLAVRRQLAEAAVAGYQTLVIAAAIVVGVAAVSVVLRKR